MNTSESTSLNFVTALDSRTDEINICGLPCPGNCQTCVQSNADLSAFYGIAIDAPPATATAAPIEIVVMAAAGDEDLDDQARTARALDEVEASNRNGEWADQDDYDGDCDCLECRNGYNPDLWEDTRYNDDDYYGGGLDWNESGYFD
jgi:hypothetical protein